MPLPLVSEARQQLRHAVSAARVEVRLASPFLGPGVSAQLADAAAASAAKWRVLTRLDAAAVAHGSLSTQGLRRLLTAGVELRSLSRLHAKVFLTDADFGLVGSANLTEAGLGGQPGRPNVELGVRLDAGQQQEAVGHFDEWWASASVIDEPGIKLAEAAAARLRTSVSVVISERSPVQDTWDQTELANQLLEESAGVNLWVKAVYRDEEDADVPWGDGAWISSSKRGRPSFAVGDLVLIYAKGVHRCNSVVEIADVARYDPAFVVSDGRPQEDGDRWPWVNDVQVRLQVPIAAGVPLSHLGFTGQSLQGGHKRLGLSEFAAAVRYLAGSP